MKNILKKLRAIQKDVKQMAKDGTNKFQHYKYLSETQVTVEMKKVLDKHGVVFVHTSRILSTTEISPTSRGIKQYVVNIEVAYKFYDVDSGECIEGVVAGQGSDTADKGIYKAITGAVKYIFMKNFLIPTGDDPEKTNENDKPAQNGSSVKDNKSNGDAEKQNKLYALLVELNRGDKTESEIKKLLLEFTTFIGKDKTKIKGVDSFKSLTGKRLDVTIQKVKKAIKDNTPPDETEEAPY